MISEIRPIRTRRCRIAALRAEDARAVQAITDASVTARVHFLPEPFTLADAEALIAGGEAGQEYLGVWEREGGALLGVIGVHPNAGCEIEVGYWFAAAARGRGLAGEAVEAVIAALADVAPARRIVAECLRENRPSWKLLERVGFSAIGRKGARPGRELLAWRAPAGGVRFDVC